jgi:DNA-binding NarL/FixJ family response regulator
MFETILRVESRKIRVLVVDHNPLLREGLSLLIQLQPDMLLVGAVGSGEEAVVWFERERPDVTLMDLDLPASAGVAATREILKLDPGVCILGLLTYQADESIVQALKAGARMCLTKDRLNHDLVSVVRGCAQR